MDNGTVITLAALAMMGVGGFYAVKSLQASAATATSGQASKNDKGKNGVFGSGISADSIVDIAEWGWGKYNS